MPTNSAKKKINMKSAANSVPGQGVGSAYSELMALLRENLADKFDVYENKHISADITHYHTVNPTFFLSIPFAKRHGVTVGAVHFLPETMEESLRLPFGIKQIFYKYLLTFYKSMDYLVTVNPYFIESLAKYGVKREKVSYIPNYVDDKMFHPLPEAERRKLYAKYGLSPDKFTVICVGQLQTRKGIFDFAKCAERLPDIQFLWAGGFPFGRMQSGYDDIQKILKSHPENLFFPGMIAREDMNEIYNIGDVMFLPSFEELFPMTVLEAMCVNRPVLLRDLRIYDNILFDYYLRADDLDGFVDILRRLQSDGEYYKKAAEQSAKGDAFYNKKHVCQMWDEYYSSILTDKLPERLKKKAARSR